MVWRRRWWRCAIESVVWWYRERGHSKQGGGGSGGYRGAGMSYGSDPSDATSAMAHTGGGGGGAGGEGNLGQTSGSGGSGVVIIRYVVDTDGDGISDADEDNAGSNKNDANSRPGFGEDTSHLVAWYKLDGDLTNEMSEHAIIPAENGTFETDAAINQSIKLPNGDAMTLQAKLSHRYLVGFYLAIHCRFGLKHRLIRPCYWVLTKQVMIGI